MDTTTLIAIYGAALSTGIASAQVIRWLLHRRTVLRVEVDAGFSRRSLVLWIDVVNEGERDEQVAWLWVESLDGTRETGLGGDDAIAPRHRKTYIVAEEPAVEREEADLGISEITGPYRVRVQSGRGQEFFSAIQPAPERG
ncbi:MAG TPA: hypothetical protein VF081_09245 [Solirubrobacterales bacterium]